MIAQPLSLFSGLVFDAPTTQGIKYAGSKLRLLPYIFEMLNKAKPGSVFDGFAGTTRVSQALAQTGHRVIANDISEWSRVFATCYLLNTHSEEHYGPIISHLNALPGKDGWFTEHYGGDANGGGALGEDRLKKPWQRHNTRRLDAIRDEIDRMTLSETEKCVLLTSLILALDEVDSTLGHFASYLNDWSPRSYKHMQLKVPRLIPKCADHRVYKADIFDVVQTIEADLAYFDPPYGSNNEKMPPSRVRYAAYYHLWTTVCFNDKPEVFGKAARRTDTTDTVAGSVFEEFRRNSAGRFVVLEAIERLLRSTPCNYVLLSYSSGGRATAEELNDVMNSTGRLVKTLEINYRKNVMAGMRWTNEWVREAETPNTEFLFLIER